MGDENTTRFDDASCDDAHGLSRRDAIVAALGAAVATMVAKPAFASESASSASGADDSSSKVTVRAGDEFSDIAVGGLAYAESVAAGKTAHSDWAEGDLYLNTSTLTLLQVVESSSDSFSIKAIANIGDEESKGLEESYEGKTFSFLGDSYCAYKGLVPEGCHTVYPFGPVDDPSCLWWHMLIDRLGANVGIVNADSGSACAYGWRNGENGNRVSACDPSRTDNLGEPDVIIVFIGLNDYISKDSDAKGTGIGLGTWKPGDKMPTSHTKCTDFRSAYAYMLDAILVTYPFAQVFCCTLPYTGNKSTSRVAVDSWKSTVAGEKVVKVKAEWNAAIREIADAFNCKVIDFASCCITSANFPYYSCDDASDEDGVSGEGTSGRGLHPNREGHKALYREALKHFS